METSVSRLRPVIPHFQESLFLRHSCFLSFFSFLFLHLVWGTLGNGRGVCGWGHNSSLPAMIEKSGLRSFSVTSAKVSPCPGHPRGRHAWDWRRPGVPPPQPPTPVPRLAGLPLVIRFHSTAAPGGFRKQRPEQPDPREAGGKDQGRETKSEAERGPHPSPAERVGSEPLTEQERHVSFSRTRCGLSPFPSPRGPPHLSLTKPPASCGTSSRRLPVVWVRAEVMSKSPCVPKAWVSS